MAAKKNQGLWRAEPHTLAKIEILRTYLNAWFSIFGRIMRKQDLLYIDGFAGPGEYTNSPHGSPVAALVAARNAISVAGDRWVAGEVNCAFIEPNQAWYSHLEETLVPFRSNGRIHIKLLNTSFEEGMAELRAEYPKFFASVWPLFVFIDPFGAKGVPFSVVQGILSSPRSEVLINLDADGIARIFEAGPRADRDTILDAIFGHSEWRPRIASCETFRAKCEAVLELYKQGLRTIPRVDYVFPFEMRSSKDSLNYFLVFASQHPTGLEKMKEAMRKVDQAGNFCFADANLGQGILFRDDEPEEHAKRLHAAFLGKSASYDDLLPLTLNETPFSNPKSMLIWLEKENLIDVVSSNPRRRKYTFNTTKIRTIRFKQKESP